MPDKCLINEDSWRFVERAILEVNPDFIPDTRSYPTGYNCEMLSKLNDMQDEVSRLCDKIYSKSTPLDVFKPQGHTCDYGIGYSCKLLSKLGFFKIGENLEKSTGK